MFELLKKFQVDCKTLGYEAHSIESISSNIRLFFEYVEVEPAQVDIRHLTSFLNYLRFEKAVHQGKQIKTGAAKSTIKTYFSSINAFFDFLEFNGLLKENLIPKFRRRYLRHIKKDRGASNTRQIISVARMAQLVYSTEDLLDRAIIIFLAKTGVRKRELMTLDLGDVNMRSGVIYLKPTAKRTNRVVFIDQEGLEVLQAYLDVRSDIDNNQALFLYTGQRATNRVSRNYVSAAVSLNAERLGFHNPGGPLIERFTPHCCRHWFSTHLRRAGMSRENRQALRGDVVKEAVDIYDHIDLDELREDYLDKMPNLKDALVCQAPAVDLWQPGRQSMFGGF